MNKIFLLTSVAVLALGASESWATKTCDCGTEGHESECCWEINDGVLTISPGTNTEGAVTMKDYDLRWEGMDTYSKAPWSGQGITSVVVENGISNIGKNAFIGEQTITDVSIPYVTAIGDSAFNLTRSLANIDMSNVETIGILAFNGNASLTTLNMPNVRTIEEQAFTYTESLSNVDMPNVETIGWNAFFGDINLEYVRMSDDVSLNEKAFSVNNNYGISEASDFIKNCPPASDGYRVCNNCSQSGNSVFKPNSTYSYYANPGNGDFTLTGQQSGECVSSGSCGDGYTEVNGLCKKNPTPVPSENSCYKQGKVFYNGECVTEFPFAKKHWTPAEVNKWLYDDNNTVTITFKKQ